MNVQEIQSLLDSLDKLDSLKDEQVVELMCSVLNYQYGHLTTGQFIDIALKPYLKADPRTIRVQLEHQRKNLLEALAKSLRSRETTIRRV